MVENLNASCMRQAHQTVLVSPAYKYMQSRMDQLCHIEVGWFGGVTMMYKWLACLSGLGLKGQLS